MLRSESIKGLAKALVLAKSKMEAPTKNKTNPHFKNTYADLAGVKASYQPALAEVGLSIISALGLKDTVLTLTTTLVHAESAEWISSDYPIPAGMKPQEVGSAVTYGRRYNACALLDIVAEDDDDGAAAQNSKGTQKSAKEPAQQAAPGPAGPLPPSIAPAVSALTQEEVLALSVAAKAAGFRTPAELKPILQNLCRVDRASELSKSEYVTVLEALKGMAARAVPA